MTPAAGAQAPVRRPRCSNLAAFATSSVLCTESAPSMSLLRCCRPQLHVPRPRVAARFLADVASSTHSPDTNAGFFDELASDGGPPVGPVSNSQPVNPLTNSRAKSEAVEKAQKQLPTYSLYVKATRTNTIATLTSPEGKPVRVVSGGLLGFKGANRSTYEAGYRCAVDLFQKLEERMEKEDLHWQLYLNGFGQGREATQKALMAGEGQTVKKALVRITDKTPIKIGGTRAKKQKRR